MADLIRKSDVLEAYADLYDIFDDNKAIQEELHKVFDKINDIPTVEPNSSEKPNNCETELPNEDCGFNGCDTFGCPSNYCRGIETEPQTDCAWGKGEK